MSARCNICNWPLSNGGCEPDDCAYRPSEPREQARIAKRREDVANGCTCGPVDTTARECPIHWPEHTVRAIEAGAARARASIDRLAQDRETIATDAVNALGELILPHVPAPYRAMLQKLWTKYGPIAVERATVRAASVTVVDERTPGAPSSVELVDERSHGGNKTSLNPGGSGA